MHRKPGLKYLHLALGSTLTLFLSCTGGGKASSTDSTPALGILAPSLATVGDQKAATATFFQGATYNWTIQNGSFTSDSTSSSVTFTVGSPGTLTLTCSARVNAVDLQISTVMQVLPLPVINSFTALPSSISAGETVKLSADFLNGTGNIQPGNLAITSGTPITVSPTVSTIYTLNDTNAAGGNAAFAIMVTVGGGTPVAVSAPANITANQAGYSASVPAKAGFTCAWIISNGTITSSTNTNTITFTAGASGSTQLTCVETSADGTASTMGKATLTIVPPDTVPVITAPANVSSGATGLIASVPSQPGSSYSWTIANGTITAGATTNQITFTAGTSGSVQLTCAAINAAGTQTHPGAAALTIVPLSTISSFTASPLTVKPGQACTLSWAVSGATSLSIDQGVGQVSGGSVAVTPPSTTTYTLSATNSQGARSSASLTVWVTPTGQSAYACGPGAGYWVNGTWVGLAAPGSGPVNCIVVSGDKIYVAEDSSYDPTVTPVPGYWLNGTWKGLGTTGGGINALVVSNANVYAGGWLKDGYQKIKPGYWLNGAWVDLPQTLTGGLQGGWSVTSLVVSGGDVYAAGYNGTGGGYWLNGAWVGLPGANTLVNAIALADGNVYAGGSKEGAFPVAPGYWINGNWVALPGASTTVNGLVVSGGDVYASSSSASTTPGYWLNGTWVLLPLPADPTVWGAGCNTLAVSGTDVYIGGYLIYYGGSQVPGYWLNGRWVNLPLTSDVTAGQVHSLALQ